MPKSPSVNLHGTPKKPLPPAQLLKAIQVLQHAEKKAKTKARKAKLATDIRNLKVLARMRAIQKLGDKGKRPA